MACSPDVVYLTSTSAEVLRPPVPLGPRPSLAASDYAPTWSRPQRGRVAGVALLALVQFLASGPARAAEPSFFAARVEPLLERHCVGCHGPEKQKAELRLDSFERTLRGGDAGEVVKPGDLKGSELFRRITLPPDHEEFMPSDGKPPLSPDEVKILELWIAGGASATAPMSAFPQAPALRQPAAVAEPLTADWRPQRDTIAALERELGVRLVPRSQVPTDGLILRTASAPSRCDDSTLSRLAPVAALIVEAELARTQMSDTGLTALVKWANLRAVDLTRTNVTSVGVATLAALPKLESLNLTDTRVDDAGVEPLKRAPALKRLWLFGTQATAAGEPAVSGSH